MRILFVPYPYASHYYQMVGLAWACRAAGHEVRVAGQPPVMGAVAASGIIGVPVGGGYDPVAAAAARQTLVGARIAPFVRAAEDVAEDLVGFALWWRPDIVVSDPLAYAAPLAAHAVGAPVVRHLLGPDETWRAGLPGRGTTQADSRTAWPADLARLYTRYGMKPQPSLAARTVDINPPSLQYPGMPDRIPLRYVPYNGSGVVPAWLREPGSKPRVCVTWGTAASPAPGAEGFAVPQIVEALARLDVEVVLALTAADQALLPGSLVPGSLPAVRVAGQLPLNLLLPTCDALIHPGGAGTMLTSAAYGVPQLMITQLPQQEAHAGFMTATGAGVGLDLKNATAEAIVAAVQSLLADDEARRSAARLQEEMLAQPSAADAVDALKAMV